MASVVHRFLTAIVLICWVAMPAQALSGAELARLQAGEIVLRSQPHRNGGIVDASIFIAAPPRLVYAYLADPLRSPLYSPGITKVEILEDRGPNKRVRMHMQFLGLFHEVQEIESRYTPHEVIAWQQVKGRFASQYGQYRLTPWANGTVMTYHLEIDTGSAVPYFVIDSFLTSSVPDLLKNVRRLVSG